MPRSSFRVVRVLLCGAGSMETYYLPPFLVAVTEVTVSFCSGRIVASISGTWETPHEECGKDLWNVGGTSGAERLRDNHPLFGFGT